MAKSKPKKPRKTPPTQGWPMTTQRDYAEGDLRLLQADRVLAPIEVRVLLNNLRRRLPLLLDELDALRAEIERLREDGNATAMDLADERDDARADLREAEQELLAARARIKQLEGCLVDRMAEAINKIPSLSDARYMLVLKRKEGP